MRKLSKKKCILISIVAVVAIIITIVGYLFIPRIGKKPDAYKWEGASSFDINKIQTLQKKEGEEFKILQLTDIQIDIPFKSKKTLKHNIDVLVAENNPDLIVITGDIIAGVFTHFYIDDIIELLDSYKIPWAPVFGNHDREFNANLYYQSKLYYAAEHCLFQEGPNNIRGVGNYILNIEENGKIVQTLFLMDSGGEKDYEIEGKKVEGYDYIYDNQIAWYQDNIKAIRAHAEAEVPSMAFFHIPLPEFLTGYELAMAGASEATLLGGHKHEGSGAPLINTGFFDKMLEHGTTHVFAGHDHVNNYTVKYKGIYLTYGVKTGNFSSHQAEAIGGTVITIGEEVTVARKFVK